MGGGTVWGSILTGRFGAPPSPFGLGKRPALCLFAKRLEQGAFTWPTTQPAADGTTSVTLTAAQMSMLLEGLDWRTSVQTRRLMIAG